MGEARVGQARPTMYRGVAMRSRTEAQFAAVYLDDWFKLDGCWEYEPRAFQSRDGRQVLPDFAARPGCCERHQRGRWLYIEVKHHQLGAAEVDHAMDLLEIVWESEPSAVLWLVLWDWSRQQPLQAYMSTSSDKLPGGITAWEAIYTNPLSVGPGPLFWLRGQRWVHQQ